MDYNVKFYYDPLYEVNPEQVIELYNRLHLTGENISCLDYSSICKDEKLKKIIQGQIHDFKVGELKTLPPMAFANFRHVNQEKILELVNIITQEFKIKRIEILNSD